MTKTEFMGQFERLCRGLAYESTGEQAEAIYRKITLFPLSIWAESVTTLLCDGRKGYLPKLEHVLEVLDREAESQRKAAVLRDRPVAESVLQRLSRETQEEEGGRIPSPGTPLFTCIKAFAGRGQAVLRLDMITRSEHLSDEEKNRDMQKLKVSIREYDREIQDFSPLLQDADAARLVRTYESGEAV